MPIDKHDLFRETGYSSGDFIPLVSNGTNAGNSTSSDTYGGYAPQNTTIDLVFRDLAPDAGAIGGMFVGRVNPQADQIDVRIQNRVDDEAVVERTGITGGAQKVAIGPAAYSPATFSSPVTLEPQFRNGDNATSVTISRGSVHYGVFLE